MRPCFILGVFAIHKVVDSVNDPSKRPQRDDKLYVYLPYTPIPPVPPRVAVALFSLLKETCTPGFVRYVSQVALKGIVDFAAAPTRAR